MPLFSFFQDMVSTQPRTKVRSCGLQLDALEITTGSKSAKETSLRNKSKDIGCFDKRTCEHFAVCPCLKKCNYTIGSNALIRWFRTCSLSPVMKRSPVFPEVKAAPKWSLERIWKWPVRAGPGRTSTTTALHYIWKDFHWTLVRFSLIVSSH